jgi:hypothetical protein
MKVTDTPAFRRWFGNSKVVDWRGEPIVVYHGAPDAAAIYRDGFRRSPTRGDAYFATDSAATARTYASAHRAFDYQSAEPGVIPLWLSLQNPMIVDARGALWRNTAAYIEKARTKGHDGIIIRNSRDDYQNTKNTKPSTVFVWFRPSQAKSAATGLVMQSGEGALREPIRGSGPNSGAFDPRDPSILQGVRGCPPCPPRYVLTRRR